MKFKIDIKYLGLALLLLIIEIYIGFYVKDEWIRPFFGDFLVVIFLYAVVRGFSNCSVKNALIGILIFSYAIECLQYFDYVTVLGLKNNRLASILLGTFFSWIDLLMYTLGLLTVLLVENLRNTQNH